MNLSARSQREIERPQQGAIAERLEQALNCALLKHLWPQCLVSLSCNEDDRNVLLAPFQFPLKVAPAPARHGDAENWPIDTKVSGFICASTGDCR